MFHLRRLTGFWIGHCLYFQKLCYSETESHSSDVIYKNFLLNSFFLNLKPTLTRIFGVAPICSWVTFLLLVNNTKLDKSFFRGHSSVLRLTLNIWLWHNRSSYRFTTSTTEDLFPKFHWFNHKHFVKWWLKPESVSALIILFYHYLMYLSMNRLWNSERMVSLMKPLF